MQNPKRTSIGLLVIALLALALIAFPSGGVAVDLINNAIQAGFLVLIGLGMVSLFRSQSGWLAELSDRDRGIVYGAFAIGVLAIVAAGRFHELWNGGIVLMLLILAACGGAVFWVWRESHRWTV